MTNLSKISKNLTNITIIIIIFLVGFTTIPMAQAQDKVNSEGRESALGQNDLTFTDLTVEVLDDARVHISWATNHPAYFLIEYGLTTNYNVSIRGVEARNHQQTILQNLESKGKYHFRIIAYTDADMRTVTFDQTFTASKKIDTEKPEILEFRMPLVTNNSAYFHIQTDEKATTKLTYWAIGTPSKKKSKTVYSKDSNWAYGTITGLKSLTNYSYTLTVKDKDGNITEYNERSFITMGNSFELNDFNITNITPVDNNSNLIGDDKVTIKFKTTRPAICTARNKKGNKGSSTYKELNKKEWEHEFTINNLKTNTDYSYKIYCTDFLNKKITTQYFNYRTNGPAVLGYSTVTNKKLFNGHKFTLVRAEGDDKVYAAFTRQKYHIKNPETLRSYGLENEPIKTITQEKMDKYTDIKIVKSETSGDKYYIYRSLDRKKKINSSKVNKSYTFNRKYTYITINDFDLKNYQNVSLIKTADDPTVYFIYGDVKRPISSWDVFIQRGWKAWEIGLVNQTDLDSYKTITSL